MVNFTNGKKMQNKVTIRNTHTLLVGEYMTQIGECNM